MAIEIGIVNADTSVKIGSTTIQSGYIGFNRFYGVDIPILDLFTSAHHAYSLRKLRTAYTGFCLRVRRTTTTPSVTTTTVDLSFDSNNTISFNSAITYVSGTATIATNLGQFAAATTNPDGINANQSIYVVTWFDQSGNGKNVTNATTSQQPRLVNAGTLEVSGSKPAVRFVRASTNSLAIADTTANLNSMSSYFVGAYVANSGTGYSIGDNVSSRFYFPTSTGGNVNAAYASSATALVLNTGGTTSRKLFELIAPTPSNSSLVEGFANSVGIAPVSIITASSTAISLGNQSGGNNRYDGYIQEVIGWQSNVNRLNKENNINTYWQVY